MSRRRRLLGVYARIFTVYWSWGPTLLGLAAIVFIPLGFADALLEQVNTDALNVTSGLQVGAVIAAAAAVTASGLFGEVFFSGAIAASLTHAEEKERPGFRRLVRHVSYGKLIAVDLIYVLILVVGFILFVIPGVIGLVFLALAGAVVELENLGVRAGFMRSFRLVRGHFWMVAAVVLPIEVLGDLLNDAIVGAAHHLLGHNLLAAWVGESVGNIATAPIFSVAVVLLTLDLIHHRDGNAPRLRRRPAAVAAPRPA